MVIYIIKQTDGKQQIPGGKGRYTGAITEPNRDIIMISNNMSYNVQISVAL